MLTTAPGPDVAPYHDRQVAVLDPKDWRAWIALTMPEAELLKPLPEGGLAVETVRPASDCIVYAPCRSRGRVASAHQFVDRRTVAGVAFASLAAFVASAIMCRQSNGTWRLTPTEDVRVAPAPAA